MKHIRKKADDKQCAVCKGRKALYFSRKKNKLQYRPDHDLCRQCWQSAKDSSRNDA